MRTYHKLLEDNKKWAEEQKITHPDFFKQLARQQTPQFLWIGCSDSRVSADKITNTQPGEIFVHRNISNMVVNNDINLLSVLQYAVEILKVKHIIVCGHYGCGGINAAMQNNSLGIIDYWLNGIKDVYRLHKTEIESLPTEIEKQNRLTELNVQEQVLNLAKTNIIQKAWANNEYPHLHGWVYGLSDGIIKPVYQIKAGTSPEALYNYKNL
ncbi:MAG: carbonic anhydrase [Niastella sp. SCN 39-18]|jgi:carbonic anhydrase|nr:carbonic anhydrase [Sphingobacteriales bacterium]ODT52569.1 MAG: carbonic anhydrase [Niastella sp. SCN 39-18]OJW11709.1 MAG: carbonic anhydrase [Sphingobacteriales bacterium 39-19]